MGVQHVKPLVMVLLASVLLLPALAALEQRQQTADAQHRSHPTATDMTMNGPVLRELEKRHEREALVDTLTATAAKQQHCALNVPEP